MSKIIRACFLGVAFIESLLILSDAGTAEVMVTPLWSLEEFRITIVLISLLSAALMSLVMNES